MDMLCGTLPMWNTENSMSCTGLLRAPTIRSTPLTDWAKLVRMSWRKRSKVQSKAVASASDTTTQTKVLRRFQALCRAILSKLITRVPPFVAALAKTTAGQNAPPVAGHG